jgi:hypothetical protein
MSGDYKAGDHLRGVVRCESCLWYIGRKILRRDRGVCPICDAEIREAA